MLRRHIEGRGISDPRVLDAMAAVPREEFVPPGMTRHAYRDGPLPIGDGQTISQPYVVAMMAEAAELKTGDRVLEVGTGSGYAAAVFSRIADVVYTIERHASLADSARERLGALGFGNVHVGHGDGTRGWPDHAPYDAIVVAAGGRSVPEALREQLAPGGRLLAGEMVVLGRTAMGETVHGGVLRDEWSVRRDGRLVWADALCLEGAIAETVVHPAGLDGATALATAVYVADDAAAHLATARELLAGAPDSVRVGASVVNDLLVIRFLAKDAAPLRQFFGEFWTEFRHAVAGLPAALPRLWQI